MKKFAVLTLILALSLCLCFATAENEGTTVYVTISDGDLEVVRYAVTLSDTDGDEKLTINDALYLAHEAAFEGGAEAGYATAETQYGLSLSKLWGIENGGSYGYYVNNVGAYSPADELKDGDELVAFVYTDLATWSDSFCYFDKTETEAGEVTLKLSMVGWDANFMPVELPVAGATITIDGEATEYVTGEDGTVTFTVADTATLISASSETLTLVPPVCVVIK
ncbi:MAG: hypothetical protein IJU28_05385 [Clostridia bacterium]|nr:hypothetical protein [Clostridia bacterium]